MSSPGAKFKAFKLMVNLIPHYLQSITRKRQFTFKEERQRVCKDDSSSTVTHVCPHHQLQVLFCLLGHLHDKRTSQLLLLKELTHPMGWSSVPCPRELLLASHCESYCCSSSLAQGSFSPLWKTLG